MLDFHGDPVALTSARVDLASDSRHGARIADEIETALRVQTSGCEIVHHGDAVLARTQLGRPSRVLLAARTDTVSAAVFLHLAATVADPAHDLTVVMYDSEKTEASADGLGRIERELPDWLSADIAILGEPSGGFIEAGCQGTLRVSVSTTGTRAYAARSWLGSNAIHKLTNVLGRLRDHIPRSVDIEGCVYREGLAAVRLDAGVADDVIPDAAGVTVNFHFAPDRSVEQAYAHVVDVFDGLDVAVELIDAAAGALPRLAQPAAAALVEVAGGQVRARNGWTEVSRLAALGMPAVNFGPGDPSLAHRVDEPVDAAQVTAVTDTLRRYLIG